MGGILRRRGLMAQQTQTGTEYFFNNTSNYTLYRTNTANGKACQGGCVVGDKWYSLTVTEDNSEQYLYCYDMMAKTWTLLNTYTALYHANSLTYNPTTDEFCVATGDIDTGYVFIDGSSYEQKSNTVARKLDRTPFAPWNVAYDRSRNLIYCREGSTLYVNDASGNCIAERTLIGYVTHTTGQGMETDGTYIYVCWSDNIDVYTVGGQFVKTTGYKSVVSTYNELEEIGYDWNGRFYCHEYNGSSSSTVHISAMLIRGFDGWANIAYVPFSLGTKRETNATVTVTGIDSVRIESKGSKSYNMYLVGAGYPFGYGFLNGKTCRVSFDLTRISGSSGAMGSNVFTCNQRAITSLSSRLFQKSESRGSLLAINETMHVSYEFTWGEGGYIPASGKEGTYIGYAFWLYADSGNTLEVSNYKFEAQLKG